jgi:hypothetical protein
MAKMRIEDWKKLEQAMGVMETPPSIGSMLFKMLEDSGYTGEEILTVAGTLSSYAKSEADIQTPAPKNTQNHHKNQPSGGYDGTRRTPVGELHRP